MCILYCVDCPRRDSPIKEAGLVTTKTRSTRDSGKANLKTGDLSVATNLFVDTDTRSYLSSKLNLLEFTLAGRHFTEIYSIKH